MQYLHEASISIGLTSLFKLFYFDDTSDYLLIDLNYSKIKRSFDQGLDTINVLVELVIVNFLVVKGFLENGLNLSDLLFMFQTSSFKTRFHNFSGIMSCINCAFKIFYESIKMNILI